jgi:iron(III) transport system permease protein
MRAYARRDLRRLDTTLLLLCLAALGFTIVYPVAGLLLRAFADWQGAALLQGARFAAARNTVVQCFGAVIASGVFGTALAFLVTRYSFPGRRMLAALAYLPFALPPLVGVVSFWYILGPDGFVPRGWERLTGNADVTLSGPWMILFIHAYSFYVFFYAMVSAALENMDRSLIEAARTLGASRWRVFTRVTLPTLKPALMGAALLTFMSTGASFSAPLIFGNDYPMLSVQIYQEQQQFNQNIALTLTVVLAAVSLLGVLLFRSAGRGGRVTSKGVRATIRSKGGRLAACVGAWTTVGLLLVPHFTIVVLSFANHATWYEELAPTEYGVANYTALVQDRAMWLPMVHSVWMSALAAVLALCIGLPAAYLIARRRPGSLWVNLVVMVPWALPATVIAMTLIVAFNTQWAPLYNTVWMLPLAYFVRTIPLFTRVCTAAVESFDPSLIEAGQTLGGGRGYCLRRIVLPILAPSIGAAMVLAFVTSLGEFPASILLYVPANAPISVKIFELWRGSGIGSAFAYSVLLMLLVAGSFVLSRRFSSRVI